MPGSAHLECVAAVWLSFSDYRREVLVMLGVLGVLAALVFYWALVWRKPRRHHRSHREWHPPSRSPAGGDRSQEKAHRWGRRRKRRHPHRPQNPTLAETGGLPPIRTDRPPAD